MAEDSTEEEGEAHMAKEEELEGVAVSTIFSSNVGRYGEGPCQRHDT